MEPAQQKHYVFFPGESLCPCVVKIMLKFQFQMTEAEVPEAVCFRFLLLVSQHRFEDFSEIFNLTLKNKAEWEERRPTKALH